MEGCKKLIFKDADCSYYSKRRKKLIKYHLFLIDEWSKVKERIVLKNNDDYVVIKMPDIKVEIEPNKYKIINELKMRKDSICFQKFCIIE